MEIRIDTELGEEVEKLLQEHIDDMQSVSPPESKHALDIDGLRHPDVTLWCIWDGDQLAGFGAIKELNKTQAELKSMRTSSMYPRRGIASMLLDHIIDVSRRRGYQGLSLETGSMAFFDPEKHLYEKYNFEYCLPFADYKEDSHSVFMTKKL